MTFDTCMEDLVSIGYPPGIRKLKYDPSYPLRGLLFDNVLGNFLKVRRTRVLFMYFAR